MHNGTLTTYGFYSAQLRGVISFYDPWQCFNDLGWVLSNSAWGTHEFKDRPSEKVLIPGELV